MNSRSPGDFPASTFAEVSERLTLAMMAWQKDLAGQVVA
jgi:hypothetical protein